MARLTVYVPRAPELQEEIWEGSGVVGSPVGDTGKLRLDFEGDREVFPTYEDRVRRAAERHTWEGPSGQQGYPTSAVAYADPDAVMAVGWWDTEARRLEVEKPGVLADWLDSDGDTPSG